MPSVHSSIVPSAAVLLLLALPAAVEAQSRTGGARDTVPVGMLPPAGKCRIWMEGVPAAQQPAPTDCSTALRQRPANGTILYGPAARETSGGRFDPSVGERDPRTTKPAKGAESSVERNGSDAEQELQRRRERAERDKVAADMRERDERARRDAAARARLMFGTESRGGNGGSAASSREGTGSTVTPRGGTKAEPPPKPPAEPVKKKPE